MHELHDQHRLSHARAAEQPRFPAPGEGAQQVDDLDAGLKDVPNPRRLGQRHGTGVDVAECIPRGRISTVEGIPEYV